MNMHSRFDEVVNIIRKNPDLESFYLGDYSIIKHQYDFWANHLPRVQPFYAVKCNPLPEVINYLSRLPNMGFDCASAEEMSQVLSNNVKKENIIYSNPYKGISHLKFVEENKISLTTFDCDLELHKIKGIYPEASLVIRILVNEFNTSYSFKGKYGVPLKIAKKLIKIAKNMCLNVVGVSFHVGSNNKSPESFYHAIKDCKEVVDYAKNKLGIKMSLLDIGGGFAGSDKHVLDGELMFVKQAEMISKALHEFFPENEYPSSEFRIIAEPGRFFVEKSLILATSIMSKKILKNDILVLQKHDIIPDKIMYYLNQGFFSGFMVNIFQTEQFEPIAVYKKEMVDILSSSLENKISSTLWGPTCSSFDYVSCSIQLPNLEIGDWLIYNDFGAYTISFTTEFNGFKPYKFFWI